MRYILVLALLCPFLSNCQPITLKRPATGDNQPPSVIYQLSSDPKGEFTLSGIFLTDTLIITAIGYETAVETLDFNSRGLITIILKRKAAMLEEVVVNTGYQIIPKERATGSFATISNRELTSQVSTGILSRLEAVANSLSVDRITSAGRISIRGLSTIRGPKEPLIIVDNFPYDGDITNLNPADVESITILRDAAAASVWGTRAGNGVIVITTKKGRFFQPLSVELTTNLTITSKPDLSQLKQMAVSDFIDVEQFLFSNNYYNSQLNTSPPPPLSPVIEMLYKKAAGQVSATDAEAYINSLRSLDLRNEYNKYIYQQGVNRQHAITLRGGSSGLAWLFSAGCDQNIDELAAGFRRYNLRWQQTLKLTSNWQLSSSILYTGTNTQSGKPGWGSISVNSGAVYPYAQLAGAEGLPLALTKNYRQGYIDTAGAGKLLNWNYYPLEEYRHNKTTGAVTDILLNFGTQYKITRGLTLDLKYQYQKQEGNTQNLMNRESYYTRDLVNRFSQLNRTTGQVTSPVPFGSILDLSSSSAQAHNARVSLNYSKTLGNHNLVVLLGNELRQTAYQSKAFRTYGYDEEVLTFVNIDYANPHPDFFNGSSQYIPANNSFSRSINRFVSLFANTAYTFNKKYTATLSARKDASNLFGVNTNNKWNPLWSAGIAWELSKEPFYKYTFLPYLRLRATYGYSGNTDPNMAAVTTITYLSASPYTGTAYARFGNFANPGLRWEKNGMLNLAVDFASKNNRLQGSIEYYKKSGKDLFGTAPNDYTTGIGSTVIKNVASMKATGVDVQLTTINLAGRLQWSSGLNFSFYRDEITSYYLASKQGRNFVGGSGIVNIAGIEGKPVYSVFSYKWAGLDPANGDPRGYLNGEVSNKYSVLMGSSVTVDSLAYNGPALPRFFGSLGNTVSFKNLSLEVRLLFKMGYYFRRSSISYSNLFSAWTGHPDHALRWQKPGDEQTTSVPSFIYPANASRDGFYSGSEALVEKGDHVRLQYITLSYNWERPSGKKFPFQNIRFVVNANNLGIIWRANKQHLDPEYRGSNLSPVRAIALGIRTNF